LTASIQRLTYARYLVEQASKRFADKTALVTFGKDRLSVRNVAFTFGQDRLLLILSAPDFLSLKVGPLDLKFFVGHFRFHDAADIAPFVLVLLI
jgi:hypothetical protein